MELNQDSEVEQARVSSEHGDTATLFPLTGYGRPPLSPRAVCEQIGLNWMMAARLHAGGWISFAPSEVDQLDRAQEAELRLTGSLVAAGCDEELMGQLLAPLRRPYAYRIERLLYNWEDRCWELRPDAGNLLRDAEHCIDRLSETGEMAQLGQLRTRIDYYLRESQRTRSW